MATANLTQILNSRGALIPGSAHGPTGAASQLTREEQHAANSVSVWGPVKIPGSGHGIAHRVQLGLYITTTGRIITSSSSTSGTLLADLYYDGVLDGCTEAEGPAAFVSDSVYWRCTYDEAGHLECYFHLQWDHCEQGGITLELRRSSDDSVMIRWQNKAYGVLFSYQARLHQVFRDRCLLEFCDESSGSSRSNPPETMQVSAFQTTTHCGPGSWTPQKTFHVQSDGNAYMPAFSGLTATQFFSTLNYAGSVNVGHNFEFTHSHHPTLTTGLFTAGGNGSRSAALSINLSCNKYANNPSGYTELSTSKRFAIIGWTITFARTGSPPVSLGTVEFDWRLASTDYHLTTPVSEVKFSGESAFALDSPYCSGPLECLNSRFSKCEITVPPGTYGPLSTAGTTLVATAGDWEPFIYSVVPQTQYYP